MLPSQLLERPGTSYTANRNLEFEGDLLFHKTGTLQKMTKKVQKLGEESVWPYISGVLSQCMWFILPGKLPATALQQTASKQR